MNSAKQRNAYRLLAFKIVGDFGASIAIPVVLFVWIAGKIEAAHGGAPWVTIGAFVLAAAITIVRIVRRANMYGKEFRAIGQMSQNKKPE